MKYFLKNKTQQIVIFLYFLLLTFWWLTIQYRGLVDTSENYYYGIIYGLLPFLGGIFGFINARKWNFKSYLGKSLTFLSLGLITWSIGNLLYGYYNLFFLIEVPYPSVADFVYILSWPFWTVGLIYLLKASGLKARFKVLSGKFILLTIPVVVFIASYYLLFLKARDGVFVFSDNFLKLFFDVGYPLGDVIVLTITLLIYALSFNYVGGIFKKPLLIILIAFVINYFADFSYSYMTTVGTFYVAGPVDYAYTFVMFLLAIGISMINPRVLNE